MRRIVHHKLGDPSELLRVEECPSEALGANQVRVKVSFAPIHPGDLLGVMGSPAFGTPPTIGPDGRVPGFEGAGLVSEIGPRVDQNRGLRPGLRVAFFPAAVSSTTTPARESGGTDSCAVLIAVSAVAVLIRSCAPISSGIVSDNGVTDPAGTTTSSRHEPGAGKNATLSPGLSPRF